VPSNSGVSSADLEFACLDAVRTARAVFLDDVVLHAHGTRANLIATGKPAREIPVDTLRSDNTFQIAEFFYLCEHFKLNDSGRIALYIDRHNRDMEDLRNDGPKMLQQGLLPQRIQGALFTDEQKNKVVENVASGRLRLDQSDLGRFLSPVISPETCRKTLVALADGGLLERRNIGQVLVISTGALERYYRKHLRCIVEAVLGSGRTAEAEAPDLKRGSRAQQVQ
jgi:hypothetical protein